jgi:hypothetical protein
MYQIWIFGVKINHLATLLQIKEATRQGQQSIMQGLLKGKRCCAPTFWYKDNISNAYIPNEDISKVVLPNEDISKVILPNKDISNVGLVRLGLLCYVRLG